MRKQAATRQSDVLKVPESNGKPVTAYAILDEMKLDEPGLAAPTIYHTLTALTEQGRAHRLESIRAFVPCRCDCEAPVPLLAICDECGTVEENDGTPLFARLQSLSAQSAFQATQHSVEIHGRCDACAT